MRPTVVAGAAELDPTLDEAQVTVAMTRLGAVWDNSVRLSSNAFVGSWSRR